MGRSDLCDHPILPWLVFGLSAVLLAHEIVLLRILTYLQWYHFAYLVISLALLGFGASGTLMHIFRPFWERHLTAALLLIYVVTALTIAATKPVLALIPMDSFIAVWQPLYLGWLILLCLVLLLPFLCGALGLIMVFHAVPRTIGRTYGANLIGSGVGALGALALLHHWHPLDIPPFLGLIMGLLAVVMAVAIVISGRPDRSAGGRLRVLAAGLAGLAMIAAVIRLAPNRIPMSPYKALQRTLLMPDTEVILERPGPLGVLTVARGPTLRSATGLSFTFAGEILPQPMAFLDGNSLGPLPLPGDTSAAAPLRHASFTLPYRLRSPAQREKGGLKVLVLNAGTGGAVLQAIMEGARHVTAVERQGRLIQALRDLADDTEPIVTIYTHPRVQVINAEPRHFLYQDTSRYNLAVIPPLGGGGLGSVGMEAVHEDYLYTIEGLTTLLDRLAPDGVVCASAWLDTPPRRPLKLFGLLATALAEWSGDRDLQPADHLAAIGSWNLVTIVLAPHPWTVAERLRLRQFARTEGFDVLYPPESGLQPTTPFYQLADTTLVATLQALAEGGYKGNDLPTPFQLAPPTDDRPFFHHFLTRRSLPIMRQTLGTEGFLLAEWGYILVWVTLGILTAAGAILILLPLALFMRSSRPSEGRTIGWPLLYFGAIGGGFMLVEILLIRKCVLVLGDPIYAVAAIIATLMVFAGLGSLLSGRIASKPQRVIIGGTVVLAILLMGLVTGLSHWAPAWAGLGKAGRFISVSCALAPLALVMGLFFPVGIRCLERSNLTALIPWAWGLNGFASVVAPPVATIVALGWGFSTLGWLGVACYLVAAVCFVKGLT